MTRNVKLGDLFQEVGLKKTYAVPTLSPSRDIVKTTSAGPPAINEGPSLETFSVGSVGFAV